MTAVAVVTAADLRPAPSSRAAGPDHISVTRLILTAYTQPVKAVLLVFPISEPIEMARKEQDALVVQDGSQPEIDPTIVFIKQTVRWSYS